MAIIKSMGIGSGSKSLGNVTYRKVRGRTIASERITANNSKTRKQVNHRNGFKEAARLGKSLGAVINECFEKTKLGSRRNNFIQSNNEYIRYYERVSNYNPELPSFTNLCSVLASSLFTGRLMISKGSTIVTNKLNWDNQNCIEGSIYLSRSFEAGDTVIIPVCISYQLVGSFFEMIKTFRKTLTSEDINLLTNPNEFIVNKDTIPGLETISDLPENASREEFILSGIVLGEKDCSTSYLQLMPTRVYIMNASSQILVEENKVMQILDSDPELFMEHLADNVTNAYGIFNSESPDLHFPVKGIAYDGENKPIGLLFDSPADQNFVVPLTGPDVDEVLLIRKGFLIAVIKNVKNPDLAF